VPTPKRTAAELIASCLEADSASAWREFVARFQPLIASVILRTIRRYGESNLSLADDLVQETFLRLLRNSRPHQKTDIACSRRKVWITRLACRARQRTVATGSDYGDSQPGVFGVNVAGCNMKMNGNTLHDFGCLMRLFPIAGRHSFPSAKCTPE
jgi:hypothetical protein